MMAKVLWTFEKCQELAKKCESRYDFQKKYKNAYTRSWKMGWLDDWFDETRKPIGFWDNYNNVYNVAKQAKSKKEFRAINELAYRKSLQNDWIKNFIWFEDLQSTKCTYEHCKEKASLCKTVKEFRQKYPTEYQHSIGINNWIIDFFDYKLNKKSGKFHPADRKWSSTTKWTYDACFKLALSCTHSKEMARKSGSAYDKARRNNWLKDYIWFESPQLKEMNNTQKIFCLYVYFTKDNSACYVGITKQGYKRHIQHTKQENGKYDTVMTYFMNISEDLPEPIYMETELTAYEARIKESEYIEKYKSAGYIIINRAKAGSIGCAGFIWNEKNCYEEARKYEYLKDFRKNSPSCAQAATKNGWIENYMWLKRIINRDMTDEKCLKIARNYEYIKDFRNKENQAYRYAKRHSLWNVIKTFLKYDSHYHPK